MYRSFFGYMALVCCSLFFECCAPVEIRDDESTDPGLLPPKIISYTVPENRSIEFHFTKNLTALASDFEVAPPLGSITAESGENSVKISFSEEQLPGAEYFIRGRVKDSAGNTLSFSLNFYGFNPRVPPLLINEFTTNGSSTHPDMVELLVLGEGNMAGVAFYAGCGCEHDFSFIFPPFEVEEGEYLLLHAKPQGIPEEIDETEAVDVSGGIDSCPVARDFWPAGAGGLSGNNGALTLYSSPNGTLVDAVLYSTRTSSSDDRYRGFGSTSMLHKAECIASLSGWSFAGSIITPEDCLNPSLSTATRSICRESSPADTDSAADWHIVPTGGYTFGTVNNDARYEPQ